MNQTEFQQLLHAVLEPIEREFGDRMSVLDLRVFLAVASGAGATLSQIVAATGLPSDAAERAARRLASRDHWWQRDRLELIRLTPDRQRPGDYACGLTMKGGLVARCLYLKLALETGETPG